jgi:hypothetical protein
MNTPKWDKISVAPHIWACRECEEKCLLKQVKDPQVCPYHPFYTKEYRKSLGLISWSNS